MQRFVRYPCGDAASLQRFAKLLARNRQRVQWQKHAEHIPGMTVFVACLRLRRQHTRGLGRELRKVAVDQRAAARKKLRQSFELSMADARVDVGQIELAAGK